MLWQASAVVLLALALDLSMGDPPNRYHPLRWMGNIVDKLDRFIVRRGVWQDRTAGMLSYILVATLSIAMVLTLTALIRDLFGVWAWVLATAVLFKITFAVSSFRRHCIPIRDAMQADDLEAARSMTQMVVSRDVSEMSEGHLSSCCVETVSENAVDSVISPSFYMGLLGLMGAYIFRCANLMDAMWGYRKEGYTNLGTFPARLDDLLGFVTSRVSLAFLALSAFLLRMDVVGLFRVAARDASLTPSPNSGWPMAAAAGALGVTMDKPSGYRIGDGPLPGLDDIDSALRLMEVASIIFIVAVTMPLYTTVGVHMQLLIEDIIIGTVGGIL